MFLAYPILFLFTGGVVASLLNGSAVAIGLALLALARARWRARRPAPRSEALP